MNPTDGIQPTAATGGLESVFSRPGSPAATMGTLDILRGSPTALDLDRIEATAREAAEAVSAEIWHLDTGRATGVYTEARPSPTSEDVASAYHREVESHIATMDPSTTIALVARVRELEAEMGERIFSHNEDVGLLREAMERLRASEPVDADDQLPVIDAARLERQRQWSLNTFGPGRTLGILDHIRRELDEVAADPTDLGEWVDVVILALDGAWRAGHEPQAILDAIAAKHEINRERTWPDWRGRSQDEAIEHIRGGDDPRALLQTRSIAVDGEEG